MMPSSRWITRELALSYAWSAIVLYLHRKSSGKKRSSRPRSLSPAPPSQPLLSADGYTRHVRRFIKNQSSSDRGCLRVYWRVRRGRLGFLRFCLSSARCGAAPKEMRRASRTEPLKIESREILIAHPHRRASPPPRFYCRPHRPPRRGRDPNPRSCL